MTHSNNDQQAIATKDSEQRFAFFIDSVIEHQQIWILTDEHGCVMLNTEDEECVPVWPSSDAAQAWATGEWQQCEAQAISLKTWQNRWTDGLDEDEFYVLVYPVEQTEQAGLVIEPLELDANFRKALKAKNKQKK